MSTDTPQTHEEVIDALGGRSVVAEHLGETPSCVGMWKTRKGIPPRHWPSLVRLADKLGKSEIDVDLLDRLSRERAA